MSILTKLAATRMQERELLRTECADRNCAHPLAWHYLSLPRPDTSDPNRPPCSPLVGPRCKCKGFRESADEQPTGDQMKVYVLSVGWSAYWEVGVFTSVELAMAARPDIEWQERVQPQFRLDDRSWDGDARTGPAAITEHELDQPDHDR